MKLLFRQRFFSWFDSYDIYDEEGRTAYTVEGKLSWGHRLEIYGPAGDHLGTVKEEVLTLLPRFALYAGEEYLGCIRKEFALFHPRFTLDCNGWEVEGSFLEWDYAVTDPAGRTVMAASKELLHWTDTYVLDIARPEDALLCLMIVLAIDAAKCHTRNRGMLLCWNPPLSARCCCPWPPGCPPCWGRWWSLPPGEGVKSCWRSPSALPGV